MIFKLFLDNVSIFLAVVCLKESIFASVHVCLINLIQFQYLLLIMANVYENLVSHYECIPDLSVPQSSGPWTQPFYEVNGAEPLMWPFPEHKSTGGDI